MLRFSQALMVAFVLTLVSGSVLQAQPRSNNYRTPDRFSGPSTDRFSYFHGPSYNPKIKFAGRGHVQELAKELYEQANAICWEMHDHYDRNPRFQETYADMYEIKEGAKRLHEMIRRDGFRNSNMEDRITRELRDLDRRFQNFQTDVRSWRPNSRYQPRMELYTLVYECEDTLHHLMDDYGVKSFGKWEKGRPSRPGYPSHGHGGPSRGPGGPGYPSRGPGR